MEWDEIQNEFDRAYGMSCKPSGLQKYKAGHIFDENMSVKWNRDKLEEENKKFKDEVSRLNTAKIKPCWPYTNWSTRKYRTTWDITCPELRQKRFSTMPMTINTHTVSMKYVGSWNGWLNSCRKSWPNRRSHRGTKKMAKNKWRPYLPRSDSTELPPVHKRMSESEET